MSSSETKKGDDVTIDMKGAKSNKLSPSQETLDNTTESDFEVVADDNFQESVQILLAREEGDNGIEQYSSSISMVPSRLRDHSPQSFNPTVVSIGPLHHEDENLKGSEGFKRTCMHNLLNRLGSPPEETLVACLRKVKESISNIRKCYVGIMRRYTDHELARMMVMDGCFILKAINLLEEELSTLLWGLIYRDLLLLENQIPFFVLKDIFECTILNFDPSASLIEYIKPLLACGHLSLLKEDFIIPNSLTHTTNDVDHILSLLHKCYQPESELSSGPLTLICSVVELENAGVSFEPHQEASWPLFIKIEWWYAWFPCFAWFWVKPTLKMPVMNIEDDTETVLRNIIAYEQTTQVVAYFTSYALAIDGLVDSGHDIAKLVESKIIINRLGSNEEAAKMINNVGKNIIASNFYNNQWKELESYYNGYWPRNIARLRRTYFNSPWNIIALMAGIILFVLTMTQTYFTVEPTK